MFVKTTLTALTIALAAPAAIAGSFTPGEAQLANSVGVEPGQYAVAELIQLDAAARENDFEYTQFLLRKTTLNGDISTRSALSEGVSQLAAIEGVSADVYSVGQIIRLSDARFEGDEVLEALIKAEVNGRKVSTGISAGRVQLAALLGVNAADYTLAELAQLDSADSFLEND